MTVFLITFLSIYSLLHIYAFVRIFSFIKRGRKLLIVLSSFMIVAPILIRIFEIRGEEKIAYILAVTGYSWMGWIFLFVSFIFAADILRVIFFRKGEFKQQVAVAVFIFSVVASIYSLYEAKNPEIEYLTLKSNQIPLNMQKLRVVQISDLHIGILMDSERVKKTVNKIAALNPDIFLSTGDLIDGRLSRQNGSESRVYETVRLLSDIQAPLGKYAVLGNHEYYAGVDESIKLTEKAGFTLLRNSIAEIDSNIKIAGVDDQASDVSEKSAIAAFTQNGINILLKHRPVILRESDGKFTIQLSGHTHKGQLLPFYPFTFTKFRIPSGTTKTEKGRIVHVSRGTGTWGPPMRFFAPPEITVIDFVR